MQFLKQLSLFTALVPLAFLPIATQAANAPSQQKVIREVVVNASPAKTWRVIKDFGAIKKWHPAVAETTTETKADETGTTLLHRLITLKEGGTILEKQTISSDEEMKLEYRIVEGVLPVSGYRSIMQVKAGPGPNESTITWTGRFYNKTNDVHAKPGEDNETAVNAVEDVYDSGVPALKAYIESLPN